MKIKTLAQAISLMCVVGTGTVMAQTPATPAPTTPSAPANSTVTTPRPAQPAAPKVEKIEVTGSNIKRVQDEGALPVQVITKDEIDRAGITSAEQLIATLSANGNSPDNMSSNVAFSVNATENRNANSVSAANLRGLGASSTLVLLNGRRVSTNGSRGNTVDLNSIPLAAVQRVEILKDGASAIYGTDAIGGVINFILRKDFSGLDVTAFTDMTQDGGGNITRGSVVFGAGDTAKDGYNFLINYTVDRQEMLRGRDRSFVNGHQPDRGLTPDTGGTTFATINNAAGTAMSGNPSSSPNINGIYTLPVSNIFMNRANLLSFQGRCDTLPDTQQYRADVLGPAFYNSARGCAFDYGKQRVLLQPVDRQNLVARGTFAISANHTAYAELVGSQTEATNRFEPLQITASTGNNNLYPVNGPFYLDMRQYIPTYNVNLPIAYRWRCEPCGPRESQNKAVAGRGLIGIDGVIGSWDYKVGYSMAKSTSSSRLTNGYFFTQPLYALMRSGILNPFALPGQGQSQAALDQLAAASAVGRSLFGGESRVRQFDASISGEVFKLPAGSVAVALGTDIRKESFKFSDSSTSEAILSAPFDSNIGLRSRTIVATYAEVLVPVFRNFEVSAALRHDDYSDFGGSTNPKYSFRFTPFKSLLIRGSYGEGFRAPSFFQLYSPQSSSPLSTNINDPVLCQTFSASNPNCGIRVDQITGGNPDLQPETSKQGSIGLVFAPLDWLTLNIDWWKVERRQRIYQLGVLGNDGVLANYETFPNSFIRRADGSLEAIRAGYVNADGDNVNGIDIGLQASQRLYGGRISFGLDGTFMRSFESRIFVTRPFQELVNGPWDANNLVVRWKHSMRVTYSKGPWSGTLSNSYTGSYNNFRPDGVAFAPNWNPRVKAYNIFNASATYTGIKNVTATVGVKNLLNTDPPFTSANVDFLASTAWDSRVADPRGRAVTVRLNYQFK